MFAQKCNLKQGGINIDLAQCLDESILKKYPLDEFLAVNDIIINSTGTGTLGRVGIISNDCFRITAKIVPDTHITVIRVNNEIISQYVFIILKQLQPIIETKGEGSTNQKELRPEYIKNILIPIPPFYEQQKIVNVFEQTYNETAIIDGAKAEINNVITSLKSKLLELAIQGKLVPQDPTDEPASVLLERIRAEKKAKLGKKYVESYIYKGDDNCYYEKIGSNIKNISEIIPFEIPDNWCFIRLKEIIKIVSGVSYDKSDISNDGIRILRGGNIVNLTIQLQQDDVFLPYKYFEEEKQVKKGDIVIVASTGSKIAIGRSGFAEEDYPSTQIGAFLRIIRPTIKDFSDYIKCLFSTNYYRDHIRDIVHGNTINNIKSEYLEDFIVPIPPIKEQVRIFRKTEELLDILKDEA